MPSIIDPETIYVDNLPAIWSPVQWELTEEERMVQKTAHGPDGITEGGRIARAPTHDLLVLEGKAALHQGHAKSHLCGKSFH